MKKTGLFTMCFLLSMMLTACNNVQTNNSESGESQSSSSEVESSETETQEVLKVKFVTDLYKGERTPRVTNIKDAPNAELIYEDEKYEYYFEHARAEQIQVRYEDGSKENLKEALAAGRLTISDVTDRDWGVFVCDKSPEEGKEAQFYNIVEETGVSTNAAMEIFYEDEKHKYYFTGGESVVTLVYYTDGTREPIDEALVAGRVTIEDLDNYGICYYMMAK